MALGKLIQIFQLKVHKVIGQLFHYDQSRSPISTFLFLLRHGTPQSHHDCTHFSCGILSTDDAAEPSVSSVLTDGVRPILPAVCLLLLSSSKYNEVAFCKKILIIMGEEVMVFLKRTFGLTQQFNQYILIIFRANLSKHCVKKPKILSEITLLGVTVNQLLDNLPDRKMMYQISP